MPASWSPVPVRCHPSVQTCVLTTEAMLTTSEQSGEASLGAAFGVDVQSSANDYGVAEHASWLPASQCLTGRAGAAVMNMDVTAIPRR